ncbi:Lsr2 family DNA-binding protein [Streptomyces prunicolor]|uniref:Lsr2 family DNA-binding protein n=1 Tax=Streptomyces prunicolor TaxID=67348 RepID=UPI0033ED9833
MPAVQDHNWPTVRSWSQRRGAAPWVPGNVDQVLENLISLLGDIRKDPATDRPFRWPADGSTTTVRAALRSLGASGLVVTTDHGTSAELTLDAVRFLGTGDARYLIAIIHSHTRLIGEILLLLHDAKTHDELNRLAEERYGLSWTTRDQIRRRTTWLRAAGLLDLWKGSNKLVITERGRDLCSRLVLHDPEAIRRRSESDASEGVVLDAPGPMLARELEFLDGALLAERKIQIGYIAGGTSIESIRRLVDLATPVIERSDFVSHCTGHLKVKPSSAEQSLLTLVALGLVEQTGLDTFAPTDITLEWLSADRTLDLVRIIHCRISVVGEVLLGLTHAGDTSNLHRWLLDAYPESPVKRPELAKRLAFLCEADLIEPIGYTRHRITALGTAFLGATPVLPPSGSAAGDGSDASPQAAEQHGHVRDLIAQAREVVEAATDSSNYKRFERAVADSFQALGLDVEWIGNSGTTDVSAVFWISPTEHRKITIEAKTDSGGVISDKDIDFKTLEEHRVRHEADRVILVGPGFGGRVPARASSDRIPLVTAQEIADWLVRSVGTRLFPREIFQLIFGSDPSTADGVWAAVERRMDAVHRVGQALWESGNDPTDIAYNQGRLSVRDLWRMLKTNTAAAPISQEEIEQAINFLTSPVVAAAEKTKHDEYSACASLPVVAARLRSLADVIENGNALRPARHTAARPSLRTRAVPVPRQDPKPAPDLVRSWAAATGRPVSRAGRLPASLIADYQAAHQAPHDES